MTSYAAAPATPTAPLPRVVVASRQTHSPAGGRSTCTVSSVFRNAHSRASSAALTPDAESAHASSRWTGEIASPSTSAGGRIQTTPGPGSTTEVVSITLKREAFEKWRTGYSSALAIILFVAVFGLANIYVKALNAVKNR